MPTHQLAARLVGVDLDRVVGAPVWVCAALTACWLLVCATTARRRVPAGSAAALGPAGPAAALDPARPVGPARRALRATVVLVGVAGLMAQVETAVAAPLPVPVKHPVTAPVTGPVPAPVTGPVPAGACSDHAAAAPDVTDSGVTDGGRKAPSLWPVGPEHSRERATPGPDSREVVVHRGDTLWSLARARLEPEATQAAIKQEVHDWYDLNASVIGPDPDLILPGQVLHVPGADELVEVAGGT